MHNLVPLHTVIATANFHFLAVIVAVVVVLSRLKIVLFNLYKRIAFHFLECVTITFSMKRSEVFVKIVYFIQTLCISYMYEAITFY